MTKPKLNRSIEIPLELIKELLTDSELRMVKQRFLIINLLKEGLSIRKIAAQVKVGTDTVVRVARMAERKGINRSKNPWVFGKSE